MVNRKFVKYYEENFKSLEEAGKRFNKCRSTIHLWIYGKVTPKPRTIQDIARITRNKVSASSWFTTRGVQ